ncbi:MAG: hypothetical protein ACOC3X_00320 [Nanoarchaeota archaeon]
MIQNENNIVRPNKVSIAVKLLWITIVVGIIRSIIELPNTLEVLIEQGFYFGLAIGFVIFTAFISLAIISFFIYMIGKGKNWARIIFLVLFIIGIPFSILPLVQSLMANPISGIIAIGQTILQIVALVLLFQKSSSDWFKLMKTK